MRATSAYGALLAGAIDYAGLFPPAALSLDAAVREYAAGRASAERWALGRFVVPAARLDDLNAVRHSAGAGSAPWPLSVTLSPAVDADLARVAAAREPLAAQGFRIEALEGRVEAGAELDRLAADAGSFAVFAEIPWDDRGVALIGGLRSRGVAAKLRMGGTTTDAFPAAERVVAALAGIMAAGVPFKATAGLHHPWRGTYRLTYDANAPVASMYGYLNLMLAALLLWRGAPESDALAALTDADRGSVSSESGRLVWRGRQFDPETLRAFRDTCFRGFGSCSFREPVDELAELAST